MTAAPPKLQGVERRSGDELEAKFSGSFMEVVEAHCSSTTRSAFGPPVVSDDDACVSRTSSSLAGRSTSCGVTLGISGRTKTQLTNELLKENRSRG